MRNLPEETTVEMTAELQRTHRKEQCLCAGGGTLLGKDHCVC